MKLTLFVRILYLKLIYFSFVLAQPAQNFSAEKVSFSVKVKDEINVYKIFSVFVLPDEKIQLEIIGLDGKRFQFQTIAGRLIESSPTHWQWQLPQEKGIYTALISNNQSQDTMMIHAFVMVPYSQLKGEYLNHYRIGKYPSIPLKQLAIYKPPSGFIEVTEENQDIYLTPHFQLKQFLCKQNQKYPKYIVLRERLLLKLELILEKVNEKGYSCNTFSIMSGYRTPYYNKVIGNVKYSRHIWGGAADIFIDVDQNGMMDDLNNDGKIDYRDAAVLYDIIDEMYGHPWYEKFVGGLARYKKTTNHGPFVHIDVRGNHARWGR